MTRSSFNARLLILLAAALYGCSGGGGGEEGPNIIDRSGRSAGAISGFSSVIVNGVAFDTDAATIISDDTPVTLSDLQVGQQVIIFGEINADGTTGRADRVLSDPNVLGLIESVDTVAGEIVVLGNTIKISNDTLFDGATLNDITSLTPGLSIEAWGVRDETGAIVASLVRSASAGEFELQGVVRSLDSSALTFSIEGLVVGYSSADFVGFEQDIANGDLVEVEGSQLAGSILKADRIELESELFLSSADSGTVAEISGIITSFTSASEFSIGADSIVTDSNTRFEDGSSGDLASGVRVEVEGRVTSDGELLAEEIEFRTESTIEIQAFVEEASASSVTLLGTEFLATTTTNLIDESDAELQNFSLADISAGDYIKAKAAASGQLTATATLLKRQSPEDTLEIEGPVSSIGSDEFTILNSRIRVNGGTEFEVAGSSVSQSEFLDQVELGDSVSAVGDSTQAGVLDAEKVELED